MVVSLVNFGRDFLRKFLTDLQQVKKLVKPLKMHVTYLIETETPCYLQTKNYNYYLQMPCFPDTVRVYDYVSKKPMCQSKYNAGGSSLLWLPKKVR